MSGRRAGDEAAKCPESLCPTAALPPSERRVPSLERTLLLRLRSYGLIRQSRVALLCFSRSFAPGVFAGCHQTPAATGIFPTLSLRIFPQMPGPMPRRSHGVHVPVPSSMSSALPNRGVGRLPASTREHDFSRSVFRGCRHFFMFRPPSLLTSQVVPTAAPNDAGQPRFLRPGLSCFVASARTGYASRPIQATGGVGAFTRPDSQPCRLLPPVYASLHTSRYPAQNSGPSGSLLLSREDLSSSAFCRFIPALTRLSPLRKPAACRKEESQGRKA